MITLNHSGNDLSGHNFSGSDTVAEVVASNYRTHVRVEREKQRLAPNRSLGACGQRLGHQRKIIGARMTLGTFGKNDGSIIQRLVTPEPLRPQRA